MEDIRDLRSGKTSPERSVPTGARTSGASLKACVKSRTKAFLFLDLRNGQLPERYWQTVSQSPVVIPPPTGGDHADFDSECAGKILLESEGLSGYSAEGFKAWQRAAAAPQSGTGTTGAICLNDQGGNRMDVTEKVTCTLRAEAHHPPCVMESAAGASCAGFCTEHSAKARGIGYEDETSPTLRAGTVPATVYENHSQDTRYTELHGIAPTVSSTYGTGGNNQPFVVEDTRCFDVRFTSDGTKNARHNCYETDTSRTRRRWNVRRRF